MLPPASKDVAPSASVRTWLLPTRVLPRDRNTPPTPSPVMLPRFTTKQPAVIAGLLLAFLTTTASHGGELAPAVSLYLREVKPLLAEKCGACHGGLKQESGLRLDHGSFLRDGADGGPVIDVDRPIDSAILERVTTQDVDLRMPPEGQGAALDPGQIDALQTWLTAGAPTPGDEPFPADPLSHWAWKPPTRPVPPPLPGGWDKDWALTPVDHFIAAELAANDLRPNPTADPATLTRRLYFDLIGLPPRPEDLDQLGNDPSRISWQQLVGRLLHRPEHGERWARHWMDVWRYSDWDGYKNELRGSARHIWRWRDWIVDSLNQDKGYDQMVCEMLAADEMQAPTAPPSSFDEQFDSLRATGFLARNYHKSNRDIWLDATVEHTSKAFLGLTLNCARCHDHKYDPIGQTEYYAFRAIFEPHRLRTERLPGTSRSFQRRPGSCFRR